MELRIYLRQTQHYAIQTVPGGLQQGDPIIYVGNNPSSLHPAYGIVPSPGYQDFTDSIGNLDVIQLTWTTERDSSGTVTPGAFQTKKSASNQLKIEGKAYQFIKDWLVDNISAPLNAIDVKVEHVGCGSYEEYVIKSNQISWCEDDICQYAITIQQKDVSLQCIQQTIISDNWQGWFQSQPSNGKKHPRFVYCNEPRTNGMMITLWWLMTVAGTLIYMLTPVIWIIQFIVNIIEDIIDAISWLFGGNPNFPSWNNWFDPTKAISSWYLESAGCNRMHPAPLIRDYIDNVCKKCGVSIDAQTSPIFHSDQISIQASSGMKNHVNNPYYNATYLYAPSKKGLRIFHGLWGNQANTSDYYIPDNHPVLSLDMFLDQIKTLFNAEWRITNIAGQPHLYFWRKDWYTLGAAIYDFTENSDDRLKILSGICYNWADKKQPAYMQGLYSKDGSDACGDQAIHYMNDSISLGDKTNNIAFDGKLDKTSQYFGATKFRLDGASDDYLFNGVQVLLNGSLINPTIPAIVRNVIVPELKKFADYALTMENDNAGLAKVIIWDKFNFDPKDGDPYKYSKALRNKSTYPSNGSNYPMPDPNPAYNPNYTTWNIAHPPDTYVEGSTMSFGSYPPGKYTAQEYFGIDFYARPAELCNYPMFFASGYKDNIYDWFHWIDDPRINPNLNLQWDVKIDLCCEDLKKLKVFDDATDIKLYGRVKLPIPYYGEGKITEITVSYDSGKDGDIGKYIELKGVT